MDLRDWYKIKEEIYYQDGSWRDIYVFETTQEDWSTWIDLVNQNYSVQFYNGLTQQTEIGVDKQAVFEYQERKTERASSAVMKIAQITVNCRSFSVGEIENDIDPKEFATAEEHLALMEYLKAVSKRLRKKVFLTAENKPDMIYIIVDNDDVKLNLD